MPNMYDVAGETFGRLTVLERTTGRNTAAWWLCRCECGNTKVACTSELVNGRVKSCGCMRRETAAAQGHKNRKPVITYHGQHRRNDRERGKASEYLCRHCKTNDAREWAYDHEDPAEIVMLFHGMELRYSLDPMHYIPLCRECHEIFDGKKD